MYSYHTKDEGYIYNPHNYIIYKLWYIFIILKMKSMHILHIIILYINYDIFLSYEDEVYIYKYMYYLKEINPSKIIRVTLICQVFM